MRVEFGLEQNLQYGNIRKVEHDGGSVLLVRQDVIMDQPSVSKGTDTFKGEK